MKALSLKQPWADCVLDGKKTIETRVWNTRFRGEFLVHSQGAVIGKATLVDVISYQNDESFLADADKHLVTKTELEKIGWAGRKKYGFVLRGAQRLEKPFPVKGQLNFFEVNFQ